MFTILRWPIGITILAIVLTAWFAGPQVALIVAILTILEISLSFDNAVVNAKILARMNPYWQKIFLTIGIAIAVFGMRLVFPVTVVAIAAGLAPWSVLSMALVNPDQYAHHLLSAHGVIAGFGGMFLYMIWLGFLHDKEREVTWTLFDKFARIPEKNLVVATSGLIVIILLGIVYGLSVATSALFGYLTYLGLTALTDRLERVSTTSVVSAGFSSFMYLEVLDASFSFDGVTGAFAISNQIFVIALGLGLGALFVRSLTVYLVREGTLAQYRYLEHGAHYAIGALAIMLFISIKHELPEVVTGLVGVGFILAALGHSIWKNRREQITTKT